MVKPFNKYVASYDVPGGSHKALLAFQGADEATSMSFTQFLPSPGHVEEVEGVKFAAPRRSEHQPEYKLVAQLEPEHDINALITFHRKRKLGSGYECYADFHIVDSWGDEVSNYHNPDAINKAREACLKLLVKEGLVTQDMAADIRATPCLAAQEAAMRECGIDPKELETIRHQARDEQRTKPKAVLWLESSLTPFHISHMAQLSRALQAEGIEVSVLTSEDTVAKFKQYGGKLTDDGHCTPDSALNFGAGARFLKQLPSQTTYEAMGSPSVSNGYEPFEFIGTRGIAQKRKQMISQAMQHEKPDMIVTSLWPSGYGPFTPEINELVDTCKQHRPACRLYSLSNDIPYLDYDFNRRREKAEQFDQLDKAFVRGDGTIDMASQLGGMSAKATKNTHYVGHFIDPLPPRREMKDHERKVLVTYGRRENNWQGENYLQYFNNIISAAPRTDLQNNPWELQVGLKCPEATFERIEAKARAVAQRHRMKITVKRVGPLSEIRQEIADAAFRIADYDIHVLDDVSTGVPAIITTGSIGRWVCGARDGERRLDNLVRQGAPIKEMYQGHLEYTNDLARDIDRVYYRSKQKAFSLPLDAHEKTAGLIGEDLRNLREKGEKHGFADITPPAPVATPDPVLKAATQVTPQEERKRGRA